MSLDRDQALDLLPLYAGGDLDATERASVAEALERFPDLRADLESFESLDGLLTRSLATRESQDPEWLRIATTALATEARPDAGTDTPTRAETLSTLPAAAPSIPRVRRHCPFCKDDLASASRVLCSKCLTPHHEACFSDNRGCSLLGCGGTRTIGADEALSKVCPGCSRHTPATAPFCAWCGNALLEGGEAPPRHEVGGVAVPLAPARRQEWARFAASVAVLLVGGLVVGSLFANKNNVMLEQLWRQGVASDRAYMQTQGPVVLRLLGRAQDYFREHRLGGEDRYASTFDELDQALKKETVWPGARDFIWGSHPPDDAELENLVAVELFGYDVVVHAQRGLHAAHYWITAQVSKSTPRYEREERAFGPRPNFLLTHRSRSSLEPDVVTFEGSAVFSSAERCPACPLDEDPEQSRKGK